MKFGATKVKLPKITITFPHAKDADSNYIQPGTSLTSINERNIENLRETCLNNINATDQKIVELVWKSHDPIDPKLKQLIEDKKEYSGVLHKLDSVLRDIRKANFALQAKLGLKAVYLELDKVNKISTDPHKSFEEIKIQEIAEIANQNIKSLNDLCLTSPQTEPELNPETISDRDAALAEALRSQLLEVPTARVRVGKICSSQSSSIVQEINPGIQNSQFVANIN